MDFLRIAALVPVATVLVICTTNPASPLGWLLLGIWQHFVDLIVNIITFLNWIWHDRDAWFCTLLVLRYGRFLGNCFSRYCLYRPTPIPSKPTVTAKNVHVIMPTIDPRNVAFKKCMHSILEHYPGWLSIVVGGQYLIEPTLEAVQTIRTHFGPSLTTTIQIDHTAIGNKRQQMRTVLDRLAKKQYRNKDTIVVFVDDHAWWEGADFLAHLLAPFEDPHIALVGTKKHVERDYTLEDPVTKQKIRPARWSWQSIINYIACIYLERHNWECSAANAVDGGVFNISARTMAIRASVVLEEDFREGLTNDYHHYFFGKVGPLLPDDDNYITRHVVNKRLGIKFQNDLDDKTFMYTTLGIDGSKKLRGQLNRWARSQWRSNTTSLTNLRNWFWIVDVRIWYYHPWTALTVYLNWMTNFALVWDPLIYFAWKHSSVDGFRWYHLLTLILFSKFVKQIEYFYRNPEDIPLFFVYLIFAYCHSAIKLWSLLTFWNIGWAGRKSNADGTVVGPNEDDDDVGNKALRLHSPDHDFRDESCGPGLEPPSPTGSLHLPSPQALRLVGRKISQQNGDLALPAVLQPSEPYARHDVSLPSQHVAAQKSTLSLPEHQTPWGRTRSLSPHLLPANVMESQYGAKRSEKYNLRSSVSGKGSNSSPRSRSLSQSTTKTTPSSETTKTPGSRGRKRSSILATELGRTDQGGFRVPSMSTSSPGGSPGRTEGGFRVPSLSMTSEDSPIIFRGKSDEHSLKVSSPPTSPLLQPYQADIDRYVRGSIHVFCGCEEHCTKPHVKEASSDVQQRRPRYVSPPMPAPPDLGPAIKIRGTSPFGRKDSGWTRRGKSHPRCYEGERVHPNGSFLTLPRDSIDGRRRCRSPSRSPDPPVNGRPRLSSFGDSQN